MSQSYIQVLFLLCVAQQCSFHWACMRRSSSPLCCQYNACFLCLIPCQHSCVPVLSRGCSMSAQLTHAYLLVVFASMSWSAKRVSESGCLCRHQTSCSLVTTFRGRISMKSCRAGSRPRQGQLQGSVATWGGGARRLPRPSGRPPSWTSMCGAWSRRGSTRVSGSLQDDTISRPLPGGQLFAGACLFIPHIAAALKTDIAETERCSILVVC